MATEARKALAGLLLAVTLLGPAGCAPVISDGGPVASRRIPGEPAVPPINPAVTPTPSPTAVGPVDSAKPSTSPTRSPTPDERMVLRAYFVFASADGSSGTLVPVLREVPRTVAVARAAMDVLLAGPIAREAEAQPPIRTLIPAGTRLLDISIEGGILSVDLSHEFEEGGQLSSFTRRIAQVVYTVSQFENVTGVQLSIDGNPREVPIPLAAPRSVVTRSDYRENLAEIFVDRPAWGAEFRSPGQVSGLSRVFEGTLRAQLFNSEGVVLADESTTASCGSGCWGAFDLTLTYRVERDGWAILRLWSPSARDGSPMNVRNYPVYLRVAD